MSSVPRWWRSASCSTTTSLREFRFTRPPTLQFASAQRSTAGTGTRGVAAKTKSLTTLVEHRCRGSCCPNRGIGGRTNQGGHDARYRRHRLFTDRAARHHPARRTHRLLRAPRLGGMTVFYCVSKTGDWIRAKECFERGAGERCGRNRKKSFDDRCYPSPTTRRSSSVLGPRNRPNAATVQIRNPSRA
jgi:hypothetical protein